MVKEIKINDTTEIRLSNNIGWAIIYREQFGHDIVPDLLPVVSAILTLLKEVDEKGLDLKKIDSGILQDALINLAGLQLVDFLNLIWAMAKTADGKTPEPKKWVTQFEEFPLDIIAPEAFNLLTEGLISSKNLSSLRLSGAKKK